MLREQRNKYLKTQIEKLYFLGGKGDRKLFVLTKFKVEPATDQAGKILFSLDQANARYFERSSPRFNKICIISCNYNSNLYTYVPRYQDAFEFQNILFLPQSNFLSKSGMKYRREPALLWNFFSERGNRTTDSVKGNDTWEITTIVPAQ